MTATAQMTFEKIQYAIDELPALMAVKGVSQPRADFQILANERHELWLRSGMGGVEIGSYGYETFRADTPAKSIEEARAYIAALPSVEKSVTKEYLKKVSDAIDYGHEHSLADEYVAPLRGVTKAMTDNLLTKEDAE